MSIQPLRYVRDHLSELIDQVDREHDRIEVTRNGRVVAVILSSEELTALEETLAVLADPDVLADIRAADTEYAAGVVVRGVDAVRALRPPTA
jgi:prevent-host-death family protein